jgi:hypothetical protein
LRLASFGQAQALHRHGGLRPQLQPGRAVEGQFAVVVRAHPFAGQALQLCAVELRITHHTSPKVSSSNAANTYRVRRNQVGMGLARQGEGLARNGR